MDYQKFQLADYDAGESSEREPWRSLATSWSALSNCVPYRGRIRAYGGQRLLALLYMKFTQSYPGTAGLLTYTSTGVPEINYWEPGYAVWTSGGRTFTDTNADGIIYEGATPVGTVDYVTGIWTITVGVAFPADISLAYRAARDPSNRPAVTGLFEFTDNDGNRFLVATTTKRLFVWQTTHFVDVTGTDVFTGTADDLFWFCPFENVLFLTNNVDRPKKYDPAGGVGTLTDAGTDFDGAGNDIDAAKMILNHKGRLLYINVKEKGTRFSHRVRRTKPNNPEAFYNSLDYSDAPTGEAILSAGIVGDTVVCLCDNNQTYAHRYRGDPKFLYDWVQISREHGSQACFSTVPVEGGLFVLSETGITSCDGRSLERIDRTVPTWVLDNVERSKLKPAFGFKYLEMEEIWLSLYKKDASAQTVLVYDQKKGAWAEFDYSYNVYCNVRADTFAEVVWDAMPDLPWDTSPTFDPPWDSYGTVNASRTLLAGNRDGGVYAISPLYLTNLSGTEFSLVQGRSQLLNPFVEQGADCSLGWIDIQCSRHDGVLLTVRLYRDYDTTPYATVTVDLTGTGTGQTVRRRVPANCIAQFHAFEFEVKAANFNLDAIDLHAAPARRMQMSA